MQVLVEQSLLGWKEYELEVMRDTADNVVIICSIENVDPMGVHTGDSITVAPQQTMTDKEYQRMRDASVAIIREMGALLITGPVCCSPRALSAAPYGPCLLLTSHCCPVSVLLACYCCSPPTAALSAVLLACLLFCRDYVSYVLQGVLATSLCALFTSVQGSTTYLAAVPPRRPDMLLTEEVYRVFALAATIMRRTMPVCMPVRAAA